MISKTIRQGLVWRLHLENGLTTREIARIAELSQRTVQVGLKAAKDFLDHTSNFGWLELAMSSQIEPGCRHPRNATIGKVAYCLDCGWCSHPNDRRMWTVKKTLHSDAAEAAKKAQPKGAAKFQPKLKRKAK